MESTFATLAEPNRLAIVGLLLERERSVQEIEAALGLPQPTISKHLRVLRDGGLVECRVQAQWRMYQLRAEPFLELDAWLEPYRNRWRQQSRRARAPPRTQGARAKGSTR